MKNPGGTLLLLFSLNDFRTNLSLMMNFFLENIRVIMLDSNRSTSLFKMEEGL